MPISNPSNQFGNSQLVVDPTLGVGSFTTVTAALAAAVSGDTVYIRPGTYAESLTIPAGVTLIGATSGIDTFLVNINGNHTFTATGDVNIQNINFQAAGGVAFTWGDAGTGQCRLNMTSCRVGNSAGLALQGVSAAGTARGAFRNCTINGSTQGANFANGNLFIESCGIVGGSAEAMEMGAASAITSFQNIFSASASDAILLSNAGADLDSRDSRYDCSGSAFRFTANGSAESLNERINSSAGSGFFASSSGAFGLLTVANGVIAGSAGNIDPQISETIPAQVGGAAPSSPVTGDFIFTESAPGDTEQVLVRQTDSGDVNSHAELRTQTASAGGGDPFISWEVGGAGTFYAGIDNADNDFWKFGEGTAVGTTVRLQYDPAGNGIWTAFGDSSKFDGITGSFVGSEFAHEQGGAQIALSTTGTVHSVTLTTNQSITVVWEFSAALATHAEAGGGTVTATARRAGAGAILVGTPTIVFNHNFAGSPAITADVSGNDLRLRATSGSTAATNWVATARIQPLLNNA